MTTPLQQVNPMIRISRRVFLGAGAAAACAHCPTMSVAGQRDADDPRLVLVILRGGLDGLGAVPATGDPDFHAVRGELAQSGRPPLPLDGLFSLHPNLGQLHSMYRRGELLVLHALGLPYRERSHFDAQQVLESGGARPYQLDTGWLGRALIAGGGRGLALGTTVPLVLRGGAEVDTWAPAARSRDALAAASDLLPRLERLYGQDAQLAQALARARSLRGGNDTTAERKIDGGPGSPAALVALARKAGELLALPRGPQAAVLEINGWDSHVGQVQPEGAFPNRLRDLDAALAALRDTLVAPPSFNVWQRTVVLVTTEFGRAVSINGTGGTDHGSGGAAFVLGGAVHGGRVISDWPGLKLQDRFEGRDLRITTDLRSVFASVLADHLQVARGTLHGQVMPGTGRLPALQLLRS